MLVARPRLTAKELLESELIGAEYSIDYPLFNEAGEYRIVLYAQDSSGLISRPKEIRVQTGSSIYLPALSNE